MYVEVVLLGQLTKWKRHADQLRKCYDSSNVIADSTPDTVSSQEEEEEEEKEDNPELIVYGDFSSPQQPVTPVAEPRRNPPRIQRPPNILTY